MVLVRSLLLLVACGAPRVAQTPPAPRSVRGIPHAATLPEGVPDTLAGRQLAWVLDVIAGGGSVDRGAIEAHFDAVFLNAVPAEETAAVFRQLAGQVGRLAVVEVIADGDSRLLAHVEAAKGGKFRISVSVAPATRKMDGLFVSPEPAPGPASMAEAIEMATKLAPRSQLLVAALEQGACRPLHTLDSAEELAIGSTFKLYVLLALVDQILAGKARWEDELAIRDVWKSLPTGITQDDPPGTKRTLRTLAERMISISDNSATDHLLHTVGRERVEAAVRAARHARPELDTPFLSTREFFLFRLAMTREQIDGYLKLRSAAKRRTFLERLAGKRPTSDGIEAWKSARDIDRIEWFASSEDLCRVMAALWSRAQKPKAAPLLDLLSINPGLPIDKTTWPYVGFKGGSEPGVLSLTWLLRRDDDKWFVVTLGTNAPGAEPLDEIAILGLARGTIELLAREGR